MTDHYIEAIKAGAEAIHDAGWTCVAHEPLGLDQCKDCAESTPQLARKALAAALPHIRAIIATEIRAEKDQPELKELAARERWPSYYTGLIKGLETAARIAEEGPSDPSRNYGEIVG